MYDQIEKLAQKFKIIGNVEIDNGFSFSYQVQVFFMNYYQKQIIESTFARYNQLAKDPQISTKQAVNLQLTGYSNTKEAIKIQNMIFQMNSDLRDVLNPKKTDIDELYEKFDGDFAQDFSEVQKRNLQQILMIDFMLLDLQNTNADGTSLPLLKKGKKINEQIPDLKKFFENVKIFRLKKSEWVQNQILIQPIISVEQQNQDIVFQSNYYADLQLKALLDFIDINDPSMVNIVYQSLSKVYEQISKQSYGINYKIEGIKSQSEFLSDEVSKKFYESFIKCIQENISKNEHFQKISREQIVEMRSKRFINQERRVVDTMNSILRKIPSHLAQCYMILKHMNMRNNKNRLLKILNFYRSVQKRIYLELESFAMKEVVNNKVKIKIPEEAFYIGTKAQSLEEKFIESSSFVKLGQKGNQSYTKKAEIEMEDDENISNLIDLKRWKYDGKFINQYISTCPMPQQIEGQVEKPELNRQFNSHDQSQVKMHISEQSKDFLNRMDFYQINEDQKEIIVVDDFGVNVIYEASLQDMVLYEQYLLQVGTYFIKKNESDFDLLKYEFSLVDRMQTLDDLLNEELEYQFLKSQIIIAYLDTLEHQCDPLIQQRLMQNIVDIMAWKPKIDHKRQWYFLNSYKAEKIYLQTLLNFIKEIISFQIENEKLENGKIKDFLNISFKIANQYTKMEWTDADPNNIPNEIKERQYIINGNRSQESQQNQISQNINSNNPASVSKSSVIETKSEEKKIEKQSESDQLKKQNLKSDVKTKLSKLEESKKSYLEQLGIKEPNKKEQLINQATLDPSIEDYIEKDANYIKNQEGYPCFFKKGQDKFSNMSFCNPTSQYSPSVFGVLDFYESLSILSNVYSLIQQGQSELKESLRPAGPIQQNYMNTIYIEKLFTEFIKVREQKNGSIPFDYESQPLIESDLIVGNPEKMIFLIKDMISQFNKSTKRMMNPFLIGKLDVGTINHFPFPKVEANYFKDENKGNKKDVLFSRNYIDTQIRPKNQQYHFFPKLRDDDRNITVPAALFLFCNLAEILRLQELMIVNMVETKILEECYNKQKKSLNLDSFEIYSNQPLYISCNQFIQDDYMNYIEDGSLLNRYPNITSGLAIDEICPTLRSNLNFQNPDSIQSMVLDGGINNLKVSLHYQITQKQILILAVLQNNIMLFPYQRALCEIDLINSEGIKMTNGVLEYTKITTGIKKSIDYEKLGKLKSFYGGQLYTKCSQNFFNIGKLKNDIKHQIKGRWEDQKKKLEQLGSDPTKMNPRFENCEPKKLKRMTLIKLLTDYKHSLVHVACRQLNQTIIELSFKVELMHLTHNELKSRINFFGGLDPEHHVFRIEDSHSQETDHPYLQIHDIMINQSIFQKINSGNDGEFQPAQICVIPSILSIIQLNIYPDEKHNQGELFDKFMEFTQYSDDNLNVLVYMNLTLQFNQQNYLSNLMIKIFDQEQSKNQQNLTFMEYVKQNSLPSKMLRLFQLVLNIFEIFYYQVRQNIKPVDQIELQTAVDQGIKFWQNDETQTANQKIYNTEEQNHQDNLLEQTINIEDENLSQKIVEKIMHEKRQQVQVFDDFIVILNKFKDLIKYLESKFGIQSYKLDNLLKYLREYHRYIHLDLLKNCLLGFDKIYKSQVNSSVLKENVNAIKLLTGIDIQAPFFYNGILINSNLIHPRSLQIQTCIQSDYKIFNKLTAGLEFIEDVIPQNCNLMIQLFENFQNEEIFNLKQNSQSVCQNLVYNGQTHFRDGLISTDLRYIFTNLSEKDYLKVRFQQNSFDTNFKNLMASKEMGNHSVIEQIDSDVLIEILQNHVDSLFLKIVYMILLSGRTVPKNIEWEYFNRDFSQPMTSRVSWKINQYTEAETKRQEEKKKLKEKQNLNQKQVEKGPQEIKQSIQNSIQKVGQVQETEHRSVEMINQLEAVKQYLELQSQYKVLQNDIDKIFIQASIYAMDVQVAAISRALETCSNKIDKYIPPSQGFCATLYDDINRSPHLEVVSKLPQIQVFLTKIRNRGLPIKTLTSGQGIVCTFKDLNECIHDFCQEMMTFGEKQLKLRTDSYQYQINQLIEIIQYKDTKIQALKIRSAYVYENIQRITNSKVFESGNSLVYALDRAMQEVRFYQEHINCYENELNKAIYEQFRLKMQSQEQVIQKQNINIFNQNEYLSHIMNEFIVKESNIFNDKIRALKIRTINLDDFNNNQKAILDKKLQENKEMYESQNSKISNKQLQMKNNDSKSNELKRPQNEKVVKKSVQENQPFQEENNIKKSEDSDENTFESKNAYTIIIKLHEKLVRQRQFQDWKFLQMKQKLEDKIAFLENKMSSNKDLWEKLTMEDERQKTLIKELSVTQHESQQNERLIEHLNDQLENSKKQKLVLENIGKTKQSKIQVLEYKTKGIDLNKNYNVEKLIEILITQDKQIKELKSSEQYWKSRIQQIESEYNTKKNVMQKQIELEMETKTNALKQIELLQMKLKTYQQDNSVINKDNAALIWRNKFDELLKVCQKLAQENQVISQKLELKNTGKYNLTQQNGQIFSTVNQKTNLSKLKMNKNFTRQSKYDGINQLLSENFIQFKKNQDNEFHSQTTKTSNTNNKSPNNRDYYNQQEEGRKSTFEKGNLFMNNISVSHSNKEIGFDSESNQLINYQEKFDTSDFINSQQDFRNENDKKSQKNKKENEKEGLQQKLQSYRIQEHIINQITQQTKHTNIMNLRKLHTQSDLSDKKKRENNNQAIGSDSTRQMIPKLNIFNKDLQNIQNDYLKQNKDKKNSLSVAQLPKQIGRSKDVNEDFKSQSIGSIQIKKGPQQFQNAYQQNPSPF